MISLTTNIMFPSLVFSLLLVHLSSVSGGRSTYIVNMDQMPMSFANKCQWYESSIRSISNSPELIYCYNHAIRGFSVRLTSQEVKTLMVRPGVLSIVPELHYKFETTRTPFFLGLDGNNAELFPHIGNVSDIVVGVIDSGVWPESRSFDDKGLGPLPRSWKGECEQGTNFAASLCNRKLIGARFFLKGYEATYGQVNETDDFRSPRDVLGHGTHTSSTAAGSFVEGANFLGYAAGVARGMAPQARVAMYKMSWNGETFVTSDILAAIDKAIEDNVHVLSLSFRLDTVDYYKDVVAIGAFAAMERGILVSASAGNEGPSESTITNVAPWITTVGAGTLDRDFPATIILGNGKSFSGESWLFEGNLLPDNMLPLVYGGNASKINGSIVMYDNDNRSDGEGALGIIIANTVLDGTELVAEYAVLPTAIVGKKPGDEIRNYIISEPNPTATIKFKGTVVDVKPSPMVAGFSSRGPNPITPDILKPDLFAPGVNILAAWPRATKIDSENRRADFNILSGTSMSCPHVSGLAALLKAAHPEWSPAAIRSALMTTSTISSNDGKPILDSATRKPSTPFAHGAGHVSPISALDPGLIYDLTVEDYLAFLCASNYTPLQIRTLARRDFYCAPNKTYRIADLNYPSFAVSVSQSQGTYKYTRVVTSVGGAGVYTVKVFSDITAVNISVAPAVFEFKEVNEKKSYTVTFTVNPSIPSGTNSFGSIEWSDGRHVVRSPVAVSWAKW